MFQGVSKLSSNIKRGSCDLFNSQRISPRASLVARRIRRWIRRSCKKTLVDEASTQGTQKQREDAYLLLVMEIRRLQVRVRFCPFRQDQEGRLEMSLRGIKVQRFFEPCCHDHGKSEASPACGVEPNSIQSVRLHQAWLKPVAM